MSDDAMGLSQRELLMEMREDIKGLKTTVDAIARDRAAGVERRAAMQRSADSIFERLDGHDRDLDRMLAWQNRADGALVLARWALVTADLAVKTSCRYPVVMAEKKKVTLYVDAEVMRAARVRAARTDRRDSEIVEEALRAYLGFDVLARVWGRSDLDEDQAMALAVDAVHESRAERRAARSS